MTNQDDERAAREWFRNYIRAGWMYPRADTGGHLLVIERLLNRKFPRGADVPHNILRAMVDADSSCDDIYVGMRAAIDVLREHLTAPPPVKKVEGWLIEYAEGGSYLTMDRKSAEIAAKTPNSRVIKLIEATDDQ